MRFDEIKNAIDKLVGVLGLSEKLLFVEDIWDSIVASNFKIPTPEGQKKELDKRYQEYKKGRLQPHDWKTVHEDLGEKYKSNRAALAEPRMI